MSLKLRSIRSPKRHQDGVALLEALIAILIFSLGILGLIGLQAVSAHTTSMAKERIDASFVASQRIADIWGDIANMSSYAETTTTVASLPSGKRTTTVVGNIVTVTVTWKMPAEGDQSYVAIANVTGP
jgi:type IV pilus assembly protein PilV